MRKLYEMIIILFFLTSIILHFWTVFLAFDYFGIIIGLIVLCIPFFSELFMVWYTIDLTGFLGHPYLITMYSYVAIGIIIFIIFWLLSDED